MKKLNKNGMTLMELIVSVALISVIMIFMYKLIADVRSDKNENDKLTDNIIKISEIEVAIQNTIIKENISKVELKYIDSYNTNQVQFSVNDSVVSKFLVGSDSEDAVFILTDKNGEEQKWSMSNLKIGDVCYNSYKSDKENSGYNINIRIPLKSNSKVIHVIEIPYYNQSLTTVPDDSWKCS